MSRCSSSSCLNGNCEGCRNGVKYCNDPRCYPNCPDCEDETSDEKVGGRDGWDWTLIIIVGILILLVVILVIIMYRSPVEVKTEYQTVYQPVYVNSNLNSDLSPNSNNNKIEITTDFLPTPPVRNTLDESLNIQELPLSDLSISKYDSGLDESLNIPDIPDVLEMNNGPRLPTPPTVDISESLVDLPEELSEITGFTIPEPQQVSVGQAIPPPYMNKQETSSNIIKGF